MRRILSFVFVFVSLSVHAQLWQFVDPRIGSEGQGRVFIGPSMPFGMVKPGPDCTSSPNSGWLPMPEVVTGFAQTHVSGTGGGPKYGNVLIQPFMGELEGTTHEQRRKTENMSLGYYTTTFDNDIRTEITTAERASFYRITFPKSNHSHNSSFALSHNLLVDCGFFLGENPIPDAREAQQFVGSEIEVVSDTEIQGYTRIRGGWNNGGAYTVYFCLVSDAPFSKMKTWRIPGRDVMHGASLIGESRTQSDDGSKTGAMVSFNADTVNLKIGISFVSSLKAKANIPVNDFDTQLSQLRCAWNDLFARINIGSTLSDANRMKRMFYTALYHAMLMPVDRSGENPLWSDSPYYDDYYAIWDTYRTSSPLITIIDSARERNIVNSLLHIYRRDGYMPDARSGNCNGRTQGGSNAEVVIADAMAKGLDGIDYELALDAMLKDADVPPGGNEEKEGRGGLVEYNRLGYVPYGIDRAGNRTVEYAYDDYCIAQVAKRLGRNDIYNRFIRQSANWKNLWRSDYEWDGMRGFIMPRSAEGQWMDSVPWGKSKVFHPLIKYTPVIRVTPWHIPWWSTFFYEATSEEYSLSIPHDVPGLIDACGGAATFRKRLDLFFDKGYYNVANEPSFLSPCLYHWLGRPDLSSDRVRQIINRNYTDRPDGLPGNDDSGAMSSWFAFHCLGLYPNAGQSYYLLHTPLVSEYTIRLSNGKVLHAKVVGKGTHFVDVTFNGKQLSDARIEHAEMMKGGELIFHVDNRKSEILNDATVPKPVATKEKSIGMAKELKPFASYHFAFVLNRQYRTWPVSYAWDGDTLQVICNHTIYRIPRDVVENGKTFCWSIPTDNTTYHPANGTFGFVSRQALKELREKGCSSYDGIMWRMVDLSDNRLHVRADIDRTEMWISADGELPMVVEMRHNPLGIDWTVQSLF